MAILAESRSRSASTRRARRSSLQEASHAEDLWSALDRKGLLPTAEDPMLFRALGKTGALLALYVGAGLDFEILNRLANHTDIVGLIRRSLDLERA